MGRRFDIDGRHRESRDRLRRQVEHGVQHVRRVRPIVICIHPATLYLIQLQSVDLARATLQRHPRSIFFFYNSI